MLIPNRSFQWQLHDIVIRSGWFRHMYCVRRVCSIFSIISSGPELLYGLKVLIAQKSFFRN